VSSKLKQFFKIAIPFGFGFFLIYLFYKKLSPEDISDMKAAIQNANYIWLLISIACTLFSQVIRAARWQTLINTMGYNISWLKSFNAISVNYIVNLGIPRAGEIARCGVLATYDGIPINKSIGTLINERIVDVIMLLLTGILTLLLQYDILLQFYNEFLADIMINLFIWLQSHILIAVVVLISLLLLAYFSLRFLFMNTKNKDSKLMHALNGFKEGILSIVKLQKPLLFIVQSLLIWTFYFFMVYFVFKTITAGQHLGFDAALTVLFLGTFGFLAAPGGIGAYPLIVGYSLAFYGIEMHIGSTIGWITWIGQTVFIISIGLIAFAMLSREKNLKTKLISDE